MAKKPRGVCSKCKAKKYLKYLKRNSALISKTPGKWLCTNPAKCRDHGANYKK